MDDRANRKTVDELVKELQVSTKHLKSIKERLHKIMADGLADEDAAIMLPTFVHAVPDGSERGKYLALDLGGSKFRVLLVDLNGREHCQIKTQVQLLSDEVRKTTQEALFDHIAVCLQEFMVDENITERLPLGFTFSFAVKQTSLTCGYLEEWSKDFSASGAVKEDVVRLLEDALKRKKVNADVVALVNDTTGTMMSHALVDKDCSIGLIFGTGTNACYMESLDAVKKWSHPKQPGIDKVIINTEWCAFGDGGVFDDLRTDLDRELDEQSTHKGHHVFEKMISGLYLGEAARLRIAGLVRTDQLLRKEKGRALEVFSQAGNFDSSDLSRIEEGMAADVLEKWNICPTSEDCDSLLKICSAVSTRASRLAAAALAAIVERMNNPPQCTAAVDGTLFKRHPYFEKRMLAALNELLPSHGVRLVKADDGSGRGAAIIAAVARRINQTI